MVQWIIFVRAKLDERRHDNRQSRYQMCISERQKKSFSGCELGRVGRFLFGRVTVVLPSISDMGPP